jgi:hypothetical protein
MSALPENELDLDKLFLPAWAQEPASAARNYTQFEGRGDDSRDDRGPRRDRRPPRRDGQPANRQRDGQGRPGGDRRGPPRRDGVGRKPGGDNRRGPERRGFGGPPREPREAREPLPLPEINISLLPDEKGVESLVRQLKTSGRAYPLFDIARLILERPERYSVAFHIRKNAEGKPVQPLVQCLLDDTLWLSEDDAVAHVLKTHFGTFYQTERTATEPPKGKYTFVAQCGMSGVILGPPNHHDYQNQLVKLHSERFSRMPFDVFKSRVKIVRDEETVKKWIESQSFKTEFVCLNMPEPLRLASREAVEKHFREVHKENIIKPVETHRLGGPAARALRSPDLSRLVRHTWEEQRRFPLQLATVLSQQFTSQGLQFFKVNKTVTHVSVARPHFLDLETTPVSEGVRRIVEFINGNPKSSRRKLVNAIAPAPAPAVIAVPAPDAAAAAPAVPPAPAGPTPEQTTVISDLHWLIHQGHVIEFANGILETAKKPLPRPPKPEKKPAGPAAIGSTNEPPTAAEVVTEQISTIAVPSAPEISGSAVDSTEAAPEHRSSATGTAQIESTSTEATSSAETTPPV